MNPEEYLLGIDLGTSAVKALITDLAGEVLGRGSASYSTDQPLPGHIEQDPGKWWVAVTRAVHFALRSVNSSAQIAGLGLSGQMHGTILLDSHNRVLYPAVIWSDRRSIKQVDTITERIGKERLIEITGTPLATGFQVATARWFQEEREDIWRQVARMLLPKDYLRWFMTGEFATDPSDGSGTLLLDVHLRDWSSEILEALELELEKLPVVQPSIQFAGRLRSELAEMVGLPAGLPVITGAADTACSLLGAGVTDSRTLLLSISTGGQLVIPAAGVRVDLSGRTHTFCGALEPETSQTGYSPLEPRGESTFKGAGWYRMGATLSAGGSLRWLRDKIFLFTGKDAYERMTSLAAEAPAGSRGLIFLPYLSGERTPIMDPNARGVFLGLTLAHGQAELVRSVMEGVTFSLYEAYHTLIETESLPERIVLAGGGSRSRLWLQIVADAFCLPVYPLEVADGSAMGAIVLAGAGLNLFEVNQTSHAWGKIGPPVEPDPINHALYQELLAIYRRTAKAHGFGFERKGKHQD